MQRNLANVSVTNSRLYGAQGSLSAICGHILSMGDHFPNDLPLIVYTPTNPTKRTPVLGCGSLVTAEESRTTGCGECNYHVVNLVYIAYIHILIAIVLQWAFSLYQLL